MNVYEIHKVNGKSFRFKLDVNPITNQHEPHIYIRHLIEPEQAIEAFFNQTECEYNKDFQRYEAYSVKDDLNLFYFKLNDNEVMIITAFK